MRWCFLLILEIVGCILVVVLEFGCELSLICLFNYLAFDGLLLYFFDLLDPILVWCFCTFACYRFDYVLVDLFTACWFIICLLHNLVPALVMV